MNSNSHLLIAYSWSTHNIGDIGITPGLLNLLNKTDPDLPAVVVTSQEEDTEAFAFLKDYFPRYLRNCKAVGTPFKAMLRPQEDEGDPGSAWRGLYERWGRTQLTQFRMGTLCARQAAKLAYDLLNRFPLEVYQQLESENPEAAAAFRDAGFLIYNSGTTINFGRGGVRDLWGFSLLYAMPLLVARALGLPYGINAQSFEAVDWPVDLIYRPLFRDANFVYCRDTDSLEYLRQRDLLCPTSGYRPDSTFFFRGFDEEWAEAYMKDHGLKDKEFITITIRVTFGKKDELLVHTLTEARSEGHMAKLKRFIEGWIEKTGKPVLICPEVRFTIEPAREMLYNTLSEKAREKCVFMDTFWTTEQAYSIYKRARIVVSMEMHSIIMALNIGTPVIHPPFAEAGRKARMVADVGFPDWLFDIDRATDQDLLDAAMTTHNNFPESEQRIQDALPRLEALALSVVAQVRSGWSKR